MRYLAGVEMPERPDLDRASPALSSSPDKWPRIDVSPPSARRPSLDPAPRRLSNDPEFTPREHSFVRTSFGKCRCPLPLCKYDVSFGFVSRRMPRL